MQRPRPDGSAWTRLASHGVVTLTMDYATTAAYVMTNVSIEAQECTCLVMQVMAYLKRRKIPTYFQKVVLDYYSYMSDRLSQDSIIQELPQTIQVTDHLATCSTSTPWLIWPVSAKTMTFHTQAAVISDADAISCCPHRRA